MKPRALYRAAVDYVKRNPQELRHAAVNAKSLRFGVPLDALRWGLAHLSTGKTMIKDVQVTAVPPALSLACLVDAMGTEVRVSGALHVDTVEVTPTSARLALRLQDLQVTLVGDSGSSPAAMLLKSGALDLSQPGNLLKYLPKKPPFIVEAEGNRIVLDLMEIPALKGNRRVRDALTVLSPVLGIATIDTERDNLYVRFKATPRGLPEALLAARELVNAMRGA